MEDMEKMNVEAYVIAHTHTRTAGARVAQSV